MVLKTLKCGRKAASCSAEIAAPPMSLLGPEPVRDLFSLIEQAEADCAAKEKEMHAALDINLPSYATSIVTTKEVVDAIASL